MPSEIPVRLLLVVGLALVGVVLAGIGTAFAPNGVVPSEPGAEFVVGDGNVTVAQSDQSETTVTTLSNVSAVRIDRTNASRFTVETRERRPLSRDERDRARTIALNNRTVSEAVDDVGAVELTVEPIRKLNTSSIATGQYNVTVDAEDGGTFTVDLNDTDSENGSVTVDRTPNYVDDRAVVKIRNSTADAPDDLKYSVTVDLANGTVTDITDWEHIRENEPTIEPTATADNSTDTEAVATPKPGERRLLLPNTLQHRLRHAQTL
ncbi:hypothetical protein [Halolamina sediminis]|uniref:hypothetical protein n=1 Tax=Halolamina sediminis TaxID=1480675 RepID=UPI0006B6314A|nr:hypothetical protein [Halolamina sediminis]